VKLSVSTLACPEWTLQQIVTAAAEAGLAGVDFRGMGPDLDLTRVRDFTDKLAQTQALLRANNLSIPCLNTSVTLVTPHPAEWDAMLEGFHRHIRLAEQTATRFLRIFGGAVPPDMPRPQARSLGQRHLRQLIKMAAGHACMPLLETHDDWATSPQVLELIGEWDPSQIGVIWDIEHPYRNGEPPAATASALGKFIRHVHFKDSVIQNGEPLPTLLGHGDLPLRDCYQQLSAVGYEGWICLETEKRWRPAAPDPRTSIPQFAQFMRMMATHATR
jgi:sugar phosphate isomerase/epimerase